VGKRQKRVALSLKAAAELRQVSEGKVILALGVLAPPRFQQTHDILWRVQQPVHTGRIGRHRSHALQIALQVDVRFNGHLEIPGQAIVVQSLIRGPLHVGLTAHGVDAAAGDADVAEQELQDGVRADVLRAVAVLCRHVPARSGAKVEV
jgi:hypothetical protein